MKTPQTTMGMVPPILFFVVGVFWAGVVVTGGGFLLFWAALSCFLSGIFLLVWASSWVTNPLSKATGVFGLALTIYQIYIGLTLIGTGLDPVALISVGLFAVITVVYLYLLVFSSSAAREKES